VIGPLPGQNMNASRGVLSALVDDIVSSMHKATLPTLPLDRTAWFAARGKVPRPPTHGLAPISSSLASLPPEVPSLPDGFVARPDLIAAIKHTVMHSTDAKATAVTAPARKAHGPSNTAATQGMGGVGKTTIATALARDEEVRATFQIICWVSVGQVRWRG